MRMLLVRMSALGDIVHTWPLAEALRAAVPEGHLTWVVEAPFRALVEGHPAVDAVLTVRTRAWRRHPWAASTRLEVGAVRTRLRELAPDLAIDAQGLVKSAVVASWSGAARRVGLARPWRRELLAGLWYSDTVAGPPAGSHVVATNLSLVAAVGAPALAAAAPPDGRWLVPRDGSGSGPQPRAVVLPGAGHPRKILPVATLGAVARGLGDRGFQTEIGWGPGEEERARRVVEAAGGRARLAPPTDLRQLAGRLAAAGVVVGGDTGPIHLAASLGRPTVAVFLASDWRRNRPLGERVRIVDAAGPGRDRPTGSARRRPVRTPPAGEILQAVDHVLATGRTPSPPSAP